MRVRNVKENTMHFCLPLKSMLRFHKNRTEIKFQILVQYDSITDEKQKVMIELTKKLIDDRDEPNKGLLELIQRFLTMEYEITPERLREVLMFNLTEQALSQNFYEPMLKTNVLMI
jgi:hypothetical protein